MPFSLLIVDDDPDDREVVRRALNGLHDFANEVYEADTGNAALDFLAQNGPVDCVLVDYSLPGHDGVTVLSKIRELNAFQSVVMITGRGDEDIAVDAMKLGAQDYLPKDRLTLESLRRSITNAAERMSMQFKIDQQTQNLELFADRLVHDMRAPLQSISGAIEILSTELPPALAQENAEMLGFIMQGADRMDQLLSTLRVFSSVDRDALNFETLDLEEQVAHVVSNIAWDIVQANARVEIDGALPRIWGNGPLIMQLLQNLVGNAIKYNRSDHPEVRLSWSATDNGCALRVSDNGIGIDEKHTQKIFAPFQRLHSADDYAGTGLGLATCVKIAEGHGGKLTCASELGRGTVFSVEFPLTILNAPTRVTEPKQRQTGAP